MVQANVLKLEEETVQAEETAVVSFSLSCLEQVKEWLERDQKGPEAPIKGAPTDARHPGKSGGGDRVKDSNNLCSLNISFSFVSTL